RGSTETETETSSPSLPQSTEAEGVHGQTLIETSSIRRRRPEKAKTLELWKTFVQRPGPVLLPSNRHAFSTFFYVVAISQVRRTGSLNHSTFTSTLTRLARAGKGYRREGRRKPAL